MKKFLCGCFCILAFSFSVSTAKAECNFRKIFTKVSSSVVMIKADYAYIDPITGQRHVTFFIGSGVVITKTGLGLTVLHVIEKESAIPSPHASQHAPLIGQTISQAVFYGNQYRAITILAEDHITHVAIFQIEHAPGEEFVPAQLGNADELHVGDCIASVGAPFGNRFRIKNGIVAGFEHSLTGNALHRPYLISNVGLDFGESGGVIIDRHGAIVGINEYTVRGSLLSGSVLLDRVAQQRIKTLISGEPLTYPIINDGLLDLSLIDETMSVVDQAEFRATYGIAHDQRSGALVVQSVTNVLIEGDIIVGFNGVSIHNPIELFEMVITSRPKTKVLFYIIRHGKRIEKTTVLDTATIVLRP